MRPRAGSTTSVAEWLDSRRVPPDSNPVIGLRMMPGHRIRGIVQIRLPRNLRSEARLLPSSPATGGRGPPPWRSTPVSILGPRAARRPRLSRAFDAVRRAAERRSALADAKSVVPAAMASASEPADGWSIERASHGGGGISAFLVRTRTGTGLMVKVARAESGRASLERAAAAQRAIADLRGARVVARAAAGDRGRRGRRGLALCHRNGAARTATRTAGSGRSRLARRVRGGHRGHRGAPPCHRLGDRERWPTRAMGRQPGCDGRVARRGHRTLGSRGRAVDGSRDVAAHDRARRSGRFRRARRRLDPRGLLGGRPAGGGGRRGQRHRRLGQRGTRRARRAGRLPPGPVRPQAPTAGRARGGRRRAPWRWIAR